MWPYKHPGRVQFRQEALLWPEDPSPSKHRCDPGIPLPQVWINQGDIILIGLRDYQDAKADVILRYNPDEARNLKTYGELPETGTHELLGKSLQQSELSCRP